MWLYGPPASVDKDELVSEAIYYFLNYEDEEMLIPHLQPVVFVGRNLHPGDKGLVYFQDITSFRSGVCYLTSPSDDVAEFYTGSEDELGHVFKFEEAVDELLRCSVRRKAGGPQ
jgi:hypothetical protein